MVFDFPGIGSGPSIRDDSRDSIRIVDAHGLELKEWIPEDAPSPGPFRSSDYAPDVMGDKVVFSTPRHACDGSKHYEVASANLDGSGYRRLTDADGSDILPTWSPDGSRIAFLSNRIVFDDSDGSIVTGQKKQENFNIYVMNSDGSNVRNLAPDVFIASRSFRGHNLTAPNPPVWSPNGLLAFGDWTSLHVVHPDKPGAVSMGLASADPAWSPDGEWIAWAHSEPGSIRDGIYFGANIYVARPDGTERRGVFQMSSTATYEPPVLNLTWTPDGQSLRFVFAPRHFMYGLYQLSLGEANPQLIAEVPRGSRIVWSPDGSRVLVLNTDRVNSGYDEYDELFYTIAADGSDKRVLVRYSSNRPVAGYGE